MPLLFFYFGFSFFKINIKKIKKFFKKILDKYFLICYIIITKNKGEKIMFYTNEIIAFYFKTHSSVSYETIAATLKLVYDLTDEEIEKGYKIFKETLDNKH